MAIALVGTVGTPSQGAAGAAVTPGWGTGESRTANNLLILWVDVTGTATLPTTPSGWSIGAQRAGTSCSATVYYKVAAGTDSAPTVAAITSGVIAAQLAEFSGAASTTPLDQSGVNSGTTSPITATYAGADAASGELLVSAGADFRSVARTPSDTHTSNHVTTMTGGTGYSNNGTSSVNHYSNAWGLTNSNSGANTAVLTISTTTSLTGAAVASCTFKEPAAVAKSGSDSGAGADASSAAAAFALTDSGAASDASSGLAAAFALTEESTGGDTSALAAVLSILTDAGSAGEAAQVGLLIYAYDSGSSSP